MSLLNPKKDEPKVEVKAAPKPAPKPDRDAGKPPLAERKKLYGGKPYPEQDFVRVTYLSTGSISGERFTKGKSGDVPKVVFEGHFKPKGIAKLWEKPKPAPVAVRPKTDVGSFRRR